MSTRQRIRFAEVVEDARELIQAGADPELLLVFMRDRGLDLTDCIYSIQTLLGERFADAKSLVIHSRAWSDRYETDSKIKEEAREAIRILAESNSADLPKVILEGDER
jgi:hypothetical protein